MLVFIMLSACTVAAFLVTAARIGGLRKWLGYASLVDVVFTCLLFLAFHGTFAGMMVATLTGLMMALTLTTMRKCIGYERLRLQGGRLMWVRYCPTVQAKTADRIARLSSITRIRIPKVRVTFA